MKSFTHRLHKVFIGFFCMKLSTTLTVHSPDTYHLEAGSLSVCTTAARNSFQVLRHSAPACQSPVSGSRSHGNPRHHNPNHPLG